MRVGSALIGSLSPIQNIHFENIATYYKTNTLIDIGSFILLPIEPWPNVHINTVT